IALAVAILPSAVELTWGFMRPGMLEPGFPTSEFVTARLELAATAGSAFDGIAADGAAFDGAATDSAGSFETRFAGLQRELARRLRDEGASAVTFSSAVAGAEPTLELVIEDAAEADDDRNRRLSAHHDVGVNRIDAAFLDAHDVRMLAGRRFAAGDFQTDSGVVIVNATFAREIFGTASPLGRRVRYADTPTQLERWYEIVGVS